MEEQIVIVSRNYLYFCAQKSAVISVSVHSGKYNNFLVCTFHRFMWHRKVNVWTNDSRYLIQKFGWKISKIKFKKVFKQNISNQIFPDFSLSTIPCVCEYYSISFILEKILFPVAWNSNFRLFNYLDLLNDKEKPEFYFKDLNRVEVERVIIAFNFLLY